MSRERELLERAYQYIPMSSVTSQEIRAYLAQPEPDPVYLFAGWLTCQPGIMEVGACCDASPMAQAIDQYFQEYPERMFGTKLHPAPRPEFVRLSEEEIADIEAGIPPKMNLAEAKKKFARAIEDALEEKNTINKSDPDSVDLQSRCRGDKL